MNYNIFNLIIFAGIIQGVIFCSIVFFYKKYNKSINKYLALTILFLSLSNLFYWFNDTKLSTLYPVLEAFLIPWHLLIVPMFFLYVSKLTKHFERIKKKVIWFYLPFIIVLIVYLPTSLDTYFFNGKFFNAENWINPIYYYEELFLGGYSFILLILSRILIVKHEKKSIAITHKKDNLKWLKRLMNFAFLLIAIWIGVTILARNINVNGMYIYYPLWISFSVYLYWIGYAGLFHFKLANERKEIHNYEREHNKNISKKSEKIINGNNYIQEMNNLLVEDKIYREPTLSLDVISGKLGISSNYLSQLINNHLESNFSDYINSFRIDDAKQKLRNPDFFNYSVLSIGLECGFNSKSSFYSVFKKLVKISPAVYRKNALIKS